MMNDDSELEVANEFVQENVQSRQKRNRTVAFAETNILKLIWYIISGNIDKAIDEINFKSCYIKTTEYEIKVNLIRRNVCSVILTSEETGTVRFVDYDRSLNDSEFMKFGGPSAQLRQC